MLKPSADSTASNSKDDVDSLDFYMPMKIEGIRDFLRWMEENDIFAPREIPSCWEKHPAIVDILGSLAIERLSCREEFVQGLLTNSYTQWWLDVEALRSVISRWTDNCRIKHTSD